ncbi:MAG TPA: hypothetical protein VMA09_18030 [Candidatus Binataceae bacterium]|nr:hypothetical protein [Candidatus Binataceae bacterium]
MAVAPREMVQPFIRRESSEGPVTTARQRRTAMIYAAMLVVGFLPYLFGLSPAARVTGLGLWLPGGGFVAVGGFAILLFPVTLALFALAVFAWFGAGMVIAPIIVWLGSALLAGAMTGDSVWSLAPLCLAAVIGGIAIYEYRRRSARRTADIVKLEARNQYLADAIVEVETTAAPITAAAERELTFDELSSVRYALERALQPVGQINGYDKVDQFQTSALRYQINYLGYMLGMLQCQYTPSFHGYLSEAQRNLIDLYLQKQIWGYWVYESAWGHLNLTNPDPAAKDNIMLTGWFGIQLGIYMSNTGDRRYAQPGSLPFRLNKHRVFHHDIHSIEQSVVKNFMDSEFCLYPCEPNWVYPICNHFGMTSLAIYDRLFGTSYTQATLDRWLHSLDTEFTDDSGSVIGLRSGLTGIKFPFPAGEAGFAIFENCFAPDRAKKMWAIAHTELKYITKPGPDGAPRLMLDGRGFDFGNYKPGFGGAYAAIMDSAREFGDYELAESARRALDQDCGLTAEGGIKRYSKMSNLSNINAARGAIHRRDDFRNTIMQGPPEAALKGPILTGAKYPDVLVARAFSNGDDLDLVLYPGMSDSSQNIRIERLRAGANYVMRNGTEHQFQADDSGAALLTVDLKGRTPIRIIPAN